MQVSKIHDDI